MVSSSISEKLSGSSPYFFRVNSNALQLGKQLGVVAVQQLHAKNILVLQDTADPAFVSMFGAFNSYLKEQHLTPLYASFTELTTTVEKYKQIISSAMTKQTDLIILATALANDGVRLAHALGEVARANPTNTSLANLKILGEKSLASDLLLGNGQGPDATLAAKYPQDMRRLIFTADAHPDEWAFLH